MRKLEGTLAMFELAEIRSTTSIPTVIVFTPTGDYQSHTDRALIKADRVIAEIERVLGMTGN